MTTELRLELSEDFELKRNYDRNFRKTLSEREVTTETVERIQMTLELRRELSEDFKRKRSYDENFRKILNEREVTTRTLERF